MRIDQLFVLDWNLVVQRLSTLPKSVYLLCISCLSRPLGSKEILTVHLRARIWTSNWNSNAINSARRLSMCVSTARKTPTYLLNLFMASLAMTDLSTGSKLVVHLTIAEGGTGWKGGRRILRTMDSRRITLEVGGA